MASQVGTGLPALLEDLLTRPQLGGLETPDGLKSSSTVCVCAHVHACTASTGIFNFYKKLLTSITRKIFVVITQPNDQILFCGMLHAHLHKI